MKKNIVALAVASALAAPVAMADAPTVYGKLNVNLNNTTDKGTSVNNTASRMGVKGSEDLGNGLKAVYKVEFSLKEVADDSSATLGSRNQYLGLAGGFGTVLMGRHDTPLKMSQPKDLFNDGVADLNPFSGGLGLHQKGGEVRSPEVLAYVSPSFGGVKIVGAAVTNADNYAGTGDDQGLGNTVSVAAMYGSKKEGLYLAGAYNAFSDDVTGDDSITETRLSAQYATGGLIVNGMYQIFEGDNLNAAEASTDLGLEGTNFQINAGYKIGKFMPKVKYSMVDYDDSDREDGNAYAVGLNYSLGKKTTAYIYYANEDKAVNGHGFEEDDAEGATVLGMVHNF